MGATIVVRSTLFRLLASRLQFFYPVLLSFASDCLIHQQRVGDLWQDHLFGSVPVESSQ
jgi:hypothetical protein